MTEDDPIDPGAMDRLQEWGGDRLMLEMIRLYLENSAKRMEQIRTGFERGEGQLVERGAHSLRSSAANLGAREVSRLAGEMEDAASKGDMKGAQALLETLSEANRRASDRLRVLEGDVEE